MKIRNIGFAIVFEKPFIRLIVCRRLIEVNLKATKWDEKEEFHKECLFCYFGTIRIVFWM